MVCHELVTVSCYGSTEYAPKWSDQGFLGEAVEIVLVAVRVREVHGRRSNRRSSLALSAKRSVRLLWPQEWVPTSESKSVAVTSVEGSAMSALRRSSQHKLPVGTRVWIIFALAVASWAMVLWVIASTF